MQNLFSNPLWGYAATLMLLVVANKMSASPPWSNVVLMFACVIFGVSAFQTPPIASQPIMPRMLFSVIFASVAALISYYTLWTPLKANDGHSESQADQSIAELGKRIDNLSETLAKSPAVDASAQLSILKEEHNRLSEKRDELTKQERASLDDQALTLQSLEKRRKQYLEKTQLEKRQTELADQQAKIERETAQKKAQEESELREKQYAERYVPIFDHVIRTLGRMLRDISKQSSEEVFTDFPNGWPSIHGSAMLKDGRIVSGEHFIRVGSNKEWEFHVKTIVLPPGRPVMRSTEYLRFRIEAGGASMAVNVPQYPTIPSPLFLLLTAKQPEGGYKELYREECSLTDYKKPIERVLMELIQNRYNEAPLKPEP